MKNPVIKDNIWDNSLFISDWPTTIGMSGRTHGESTETTPAENETKKPMFIRYYSMNLNDFIE
jgi:hypothetical protein